MKFMCLVAAVVCGSCQYYWQSNTRWWESCWHQRLLFWHARWCHVNSTACHRWSWKIKPGTAGLTNVFDLKSYSDINNNNSNNNHLMAVIQGKLGELVPESGWQKYRRCPDATLLMSPRWESAAWGPQSRPSGRSWPRSTPGRPSSS